MAFLSGNERGNGEKSGPHSFTNRPPYGILTLIETQIEREGRPWI